MSSAPDPNFGSSGFKPKPFEKVNAPLSEESSKPIEVKAILQENLTARTAIAPLVLDLRRKTSRRRRDYFLLMTIGNSAILLVMIYLPRDPLVRTLGWSVLALYSAAVTWILWGIMDDY